MENCGDDRLRIFIKTMTEIVRTSTDEAEVLARGEVALKGLVARDGWLDDAFAKPAAAHARQYLLHCDAEEAFSIVSVAWGPGHGVQPHDHTVWGLVGVLRGAEVSTTYALSDLGLLPLTETRYEEGEVERLSPANGDIHSVVNGAHERTSVSIHVYGGNIGRTSRSFYEPDGTRTPFLSPYAETALPNVWALTDLGQATVRRISPACFRHDLLARREIVMIDLREEAAFATGHPLTAINIPLGELEFRAHRSVPRRATPIVMYDNGEGLIERGAKALRGLGYTDVSQLENGLGGWSGAGLELFTRLNAHPKAFAELMATARATPELPAQGLHQLMQSNAKVVLVDVRPTNEFETLSIPGAVNAPGMELLTQVHAIAPDPETLIVVTCAGRTRGLIAAQSLIDVGVANRVTALENGILGWRLAGYPIERRRTSASSKVSEPPPFGLIASARRLASRAGVRRIARPALDAMIEDTSRTTYCFDVRRLDEFLAVHPLGFRHAPGGQLLQEADCYAPVRGARVVLADDLGVRADVTAYWLAQMGFDVLVLDGALTAAVEAGETHDEAPSTPSVPDISPAKLKDQLDTGMVTVIDLAHSSEHQAGHIPGARFAIRARLAADIAALPPQREIILTSSDGVSARLAAADLSEVLPRSALVLAGGTSAWARAGYPIESGLNAPLSALDDSHSRTYDGFENNPDVMQAYLDWEHGLVDQLHRDGAHGFRLFGALEHSGGRDFH